MSGCLPIMLSACGVKPHAVVFTRGPNLVTVEAKQRKHQADRYIHFDLDPRPRKAADTWDLFWAPLSKRESLVARSRREKLPQDEDLQMLTELTLDRLSLWGRILRRHGFIQDGYVLESASEKY